MRYILTLHLQKLYHKFQESDFKKLKDGREGYEKKEKW